jgi:glucose/arabinose dehydrogenase
MLSVRFAAFLAFPALAFVAPVAACGDATDAAGGGAAPGVDGGPGTDAAPPPSRSKGDPCRGQALPDDQHFVASGLCARLVSTTVSQLRQITFAPNGDMFGQSSSGTIWLFRDADDDGFFSKEEIHAWADSGGNGNNVHVDVAGGFVYAGSVDGVKRFAYDPAALMGGPAEDVVVGQPRGGHLKHTAHVYDGFLYVNSGSAGNATHEKGGGQSDYDTDRSLIKRFDLSKLTPGTPFDWAEGEPYTLGVRNANGFSRNETTGRIYAVVNGLDKQMYKGVDVHADNPGEQVVEVAGGKSYGYPFCFTAQRIVDQGTLVPPGTQLVNIPSYEDNPHDDAWCAANSSMPTTFVQAHSAPLDIAFFDKQAQGALPEKWRGGAFIALHGSWNRSPGTGYKVVWQPFNEDGTAPMPTSTNQTTTFPYEVVFGGGTVAGGPKDDKWAWSTGDAGESPRPAGVAVSPIDGALYIASDSGGLVYRVGIEK